MRPQERNQGIKKQLEEAYKDIRKQRQKKSQIEKQKEAIEIVELIENE